MKGFSEGGPGKMRVGGQKVECVQTVEVLHIRKCGMV